MTTSQLENKERERRLEDLLSDSAGRFPDAMAIRAREKSITYRELAEAARAVSRDLKAAGIQPGDAVGIHLSKSIETVAAMFGVLECGAAYVPLDPSAPATRIAYIIEDAEISAIISDASRLKGLTQVSNLRIKTFTISLDDRNRCNLTAFAPSAKEEKEGRETIADETDAPGKNLQTREDAVAYILYTSGSTGRPKGVMISHAAALAFVDWSGDHFNVGPGDRVSNHAPLHFDLSIFDIFASIRGGATVILVPAELSSFPRSLADFIQREEITVWYSVPSVLTGLVLRGQLERGSFPRLRLVLFAGEVFPLKYLRRLRELWPEPEFHNLYGPTETNVCACYPVLEIPGDGESLPIGRACAGDTLFALREDNQMAGVGETGELIVAGPTLMQGYKGAREKTDAVMTLDARGRRAYRTGDLVQLREDGNYIFLGRRDEMIKSRGYRIEPAEVEAILNEHEAVERAAVFAVPHDEFGHVLRAILVVHPDKNPEHQEILRHCARRLPAYMIPADISLRDSLPLTSTGKIDKTIPPEPSGKKT